MPATSPPQPVARPVPPTDDPGGLPAALQPAHRPVLAHIVEQHAEEAALLRDVRTRLVRAPHVGLFALARHDERIEAHVDGLAVASAAGAAACAAAARAVPGCGETFALAQHALRARDEPLFAQALALAAESPAAQRGLASALGWASAAQLQGVAKHLLDARPPHARALGLTACRLHGVDPGPALAAALSDSDDAVRCTALRTVATLGRTDLLPRCLSLLASDEPDAVFWAAWAACLLGDRGAALPVLAVAARQPGPLAPRAMALLLAASPFDVAAAWSRDLFAAMLTAPADAVAMRRLLGALALLGDLRLVPWLVERMADAAWARAAGAAFTWITGADLARLQLETLQPPTRAETAGDEPTDADLAIDEDEDLPWPDVDRVQRWWADAQPALAAAGPRHFLGRPPEAENARDVLRHGTQRQRAHAAALITLLQPGTALFDVAAPARRQQRRLGLPGSPA